MPEVEISSPRTGARVKRTFTVSGWCDAGDGKKVTVSGVTSTTPLEFVLAGGDVNWSVTATGVTPGTYTLSVSAPACGSDDADDVEVQDNPEISVDSMVIELSNPDAPADVNVVISGSYIPVGGGRTTWVMVLVHLYKKRKKSRVYSAGIAILTPPQGGNPGSWTIKLPVPSLPANDPRQIVVEALRIGAVGTDAGGKVVKTSTRKR